MSSSSSPSSSPSSLSPSPPLPSTSFGITLQDQRFYLALRRIYNLFQRQYSSIAIPEDNLPYQLIESTPKNQHQHTIFLGLADLSFHSAEKLFSSPRLEILVQELKSLGSITVYPPEIREFSLLVADNDRNCRIETWFELGFSLDHEDGFLHPSLYDICHLLPQILDSADFELAEPRPQFSIHANDIQKLPSSPSLSFSSSSSAFKKTFLSQARSRNKEDLQELCRIIQQNWSPVQLQIHSIAFFDAREKTICMEHTLEEPVQPKCFVEPHLPQNVWNRVLKRLPFCVTGPCYRYSNEKRSFEPFYEAEKFHLPKKINKIRVISWNILFPLFNPEEIYSDVRYPRIIDYLSKMNADVVALEEVTPAFLIALENSHWVKKNGLYLSDITDWQKTIDPYGQVLISRFPFNVFHHSFSNQKQLIVAVFNFHNQRLCLPVIHLTAAKPLGSRQNLQMEIIIHICESACKSSTDASGNRITQRPDILIAGDFNFGDNASHFLIRKDFVDCWKLLRPTDRGISFDPNNNLLSKLNSRTGIPERIDRMLLRSKWIIPSHIDLFGTESFSLAADLSLKPHFYSDHYGLLCDFELLPERIEKIYKSLANAPSNSVIDQFLRNLIRGSCWYPSEDDRQALRQTVSQLVQLLISVFGERSWDLRFIGSALFGVWTKGSDVNAIIFSDSMNLASFIKELNQTIRHPNSRLCHQLDLSKTFVSYPETQPDTEQQQQQQRQEKRGEEEEGSRKVAADLPVTRIELYFQNTKIKVELGFISSALPEEGANRRKGQEMHDRNALSFGNLFPENEKPEEINVSGIERLYLEFSELKAYLSILEVNETIRSINYNYSLFRDTLLTLKIWSLDRGIYSRKLGYLNGASLMVLFCKLPSLSPQIPRASIFSLLQFFFEVYSDWPWSYRFLSLSGKINFRDFSPALQCYEYDPAGDDTGEESEEPEVAGDSISSASSIVPAASLSSFPAKLATGQKPRKRISLPVFTSSCPYQLTLPCTTQSHKFFISEELHRARTLTAIPSFVSLCSLLQPSQFVDLSENGRRKDWAFLRLKFWSTNPEDFDHWRNYVLFKLPAIISVMENVELVAQPFCFEIEGSGESDYEETREIQSELIGNVVLGVYAGYTELSNRERILCRIKENHHKISQQLENSWASKKPNMYFKTFFLDSMATVVFSHQLSSAAKLSHPPSQLDVSLLYGLPLRPPEPESSSK